MEEEGAKKTTLVLDWEKLLRDDDDPPAVLVVKPTTASTQPSKQSEMGSAQQLNSQRDEFFNTLSDHELNESIQRKRRTLDSEADGCEKPTQSTSLSTTGVSNDFIEETTSSQAHSQSAFASHFCRKMEESTYCGTTDAFNKELAVLSHCDSRKMTNKGKLSQRERRKGRSSRQCSSNISKHVYLNNDKKGRASPTSLRQIGENLSSCFTEKKDAFQVLRPNRSRPKKEQTIVLIDEDESQILETTEQEDKLAESLKGAKITYPSRDDPESIEICYADVDCLAPEGFLTSTIMNFYIRYIQQQASPTNRAICDYHFFNTYFYKKLKEAVSYKGNDKENFFVKFRRWWKGVNIFQKAYVLIPIHEDLHWSLVIICIPDKEDESGPIILHLDSLRLHSSQSIFQNIKCFLKEEWNYLVQEVTPSDLPIADHIWKHLPRRINENVIAVPQQKNDSDCGLFVLFFMERFIEEAPERLKKKDLAMFGKQWFKPEEASGLRAKIRKILVNEFQKPCEVDHISESFPLSTSEGDDSD
ncbi:hypothetical protein FH972_009140 [Carpinus fangiana]|uniref:Ubiquitin-like protease family profile domain-containing protein n=1 Tax=Carpinus fangiana TaxID=176857 RepID=A0A5N6R0Y5_9ROSI|nr:hypothetical protein FH972_009140 [Carpinus fangiana]